MGLADNLKNMANNIQQTAHSTSITAAQRFLRLTSGFFIGLVIALVIQEMTKSGTLMLVFFNVLIMAIIFKLLARFQIFQILIFDLICVLIAALLRMYIMIAP